MADCKQRNYPCQEPKVYFASLVKELRSSRGCSKNGTAPYIWNR